MLVGALCSALSSKLAEQKLTVVDGWSLETHKTKAFRQSLDKLSGKPAPLCWSKTAATGISSWPAAIWME